MWEPFIDSVVICTMTAITIIITGVYRNSGADGVQMTAQALKTVAPWFSSLLTLAVVLFAFSTMLSYSFYGKKAVGYLFGNYHRRAHLQRTLPHLAGSRSCDKYGIDS